MGDEITRCYFLCQDTVEELPSKVTSAGDKSFVEDDPCPGCSAVFFFENVAVFFCVFFLGGGVGGKVLQNEQKKPSNNRITKVMCKFKPFQEFK